MLRIILSATVIFFCLITLTTFASSESTDTESDKPPTESETTQKFTSNQMELTKGYSMKGYADFSPDGKYIVFTSSKGITETEPESNLWVMPSDGGYPRRLTRGGGHHGVFSPDGKQIVFDGKLGSEVCLIPSDGGESERIVPEEINVEHSGNPCWSPDGTKIAFRAFDELMILDMASGEITSVFQKVDYKPMPLQWSKTDDCILVACVSPEKQDGDLWKIPLDGSDPQQMTFHQFYVSQATVSPCGKYILFSSIEDHKGYNLYVIPYEGGRDIKITDDTWHYVEPCWCPVDNRVVYTSLRSGYIELWTLELDVDEIEEALATQRVF